VRNDLVVKLFVLFVLIGVCLIPLGLIWGVVAGRARYRDRVTADIGQTTARAQMLCGPILVVETPVRRLAAPREGQRDSFATRREQIVLPETLVANSSVKVEARQRGIYRVPVFQSKTHLSATFTTSTSPDLDPGWEIAGAARGRLVFGVTDSRGLRIVPRVRRDGVPVEVRPETGLSWVAQGFSAPFELSSKAAKTTIDVDLEITGTQQLGLVPLGGNTDFEVESNWPHPAFAGGFSPDEREISSHGFKARWRVSRFATGVPAAIAARQSTDLLGKQGCDLSVRFVQPVDVYQQSERAVKYGVLFVALTFVAFFMFETLGRLAIHPIQYALVAGALAIFFLLLISLSEHVPFAVAYVVGSGACVSLLIFYAGHVLGGVTRGLGFGAMLGTLYILLYVILQSEDYALLLGALLLFAALATVMVMTRRVDWYRLNEGLSRKP